MGGEGFYEYVCVLANCDGCPVHLFNLKESHREYVLIDGKGERKTVRRKLNKSEQWQMNCAEAAGF